jgi:hypothetical protein
MMAHAHPGRLLDFEDSDAVWATAAPAATAPALWLLAVVVGAGGGATTVAVCVTVLVCGGAVTVVVCAGVVTVVVWGGAVSVFVSVTVLGAGGGLDVAAVLAAVEVADVGGAVASFSARLLVLVTVPWPAPPVAPPDPHAAKQSPASTSPRATIVQRSGWKLTAERRREGGLRADTTARERIAWPNLRT